MASKYTWETMLTQIRKTPNGIRTGKDALTDEDNEICLQLKQKGLIEEEKGSDGYTRYAAWSGQTRS